MCWEFQIIRLLLTVCWPLFREKHPDILSPSFTFPIPSLALWTYEKTNLIFAQKLGSNRCGAAVALHVTAQMVTESFNKKVRTVERPEPQLKLMVTFQRWIGHSKFVYIPFNINRNQNHFLMFGLKLEKLSEMNYSGWFHLVAVVSEDFRR